MVKNLMLTIDHILQAKAHPDYYKLTWIEAEPSNENWYSQLDAMQDKVLELSQVETMVFFKALFDQFPTLQAVGLNLTQPSKNGYYPTILLVNLEDSEKDELKHLIKRHQVDPAFAGAIRQLMSTLVPKACAHAWKRWKESDISENQIWYEREDVHETHQRIMKASKEMVSQLEKLSLSQTLPAPSKTKANKKL